MRNYFLRAGFVLILFSLLCYAISQKTQAGYAALLQLYADAQLNYDKATNLSKVKDYGAKEEAQEKEWNNQALKGFSLLYHQIPKGLPVYDSLRFYTSFKIGELQHYFENFSEAVLYYKEAISIKEKSSLPDSLLFKPYLYAGIIFYNQNKFDTAISFFKSAEKVQAAYNNKLLEGERLYNILGVLYYERGNYKQAQNYFQKALALLPTSNAYYDELFVNYNINLAQLHLRLEEYDKANEIYQRLLPRKINLNEIYHNMGTLNLSLGAAAKAISYFRKVHYQNNKTIRLYNSMGAAFFNLPQYDSALHYYKKAIAAYQSLGANTDPVGYGLVLKNLGDYTAHLKKNEEALTWFQKALHQFYPAFTSEDVHTDPQEFSGVFSYINLFGALHAKAETWHNIYLTSKKIEAAQQELKAYQSAFKLIEYVERTYDSDEARLFLTKIKYAVHNKPIDIAFELYRQTADRKYLEALYYLDQQNKAAVLSLNRQLNTELSATTSPYLQKEQQLKTAITRLSIRASQISDSAQLVSINNSIRDYEIELGKLQETMSQKQKIKEHNIPSLSFLQTSLLDDKTVLVSYHLSDEKLTTLFITKNNIVCNQQALPPQFYEDIQREILQIKTPSSNAIQLQKPDYYSLLFPNIPMDQFEQVLIIPDDVLAYFPFETLRNKEGKYLVEKVAVQYQFSTALLEKNETDFSDAQTLSLAPFAHQAYTDSLPQLPASANEISGVEGKKIFDAAATKEAFLKNSAAFKIVHLATHAVANNSADKLSYIAFAPSGQKGEQFLYAQEIYNLSLQNTGLIILSACETGAGNLVKGEGVLSLSRAFTYAGCPNIITSLWKADDFSTAYLTTHIHRYLREDYSITKAVQKAKIDYLNDRSINPRLKQPYYWSHLVFVGAYTPEKGFQWGWFLVAGLVSILALVILVKKPGKAGH